MANVGDTPNADIIFRGIDGNECEAFVVAIRELAFTKGKDHDPEWMLRYATTRLRHKALRWHAKLDLSIRKDWDLFVQALFEEYPLVEERDVGGIATPVWTSTTISPARSTITLPGDDRHLTTAQSDSSEVVPPKTAEVSTSTAPDGKLAHPTTQMYDPLLPGHQMGRLIIIYEEGRQGPHYVSAASKRATSNIQEALIVTFIPSSKPHHIGCFNGQGAKLGIQLCSPDNSQLHQLVGYSVLDLPIGINPGSSQNVFNIWNVLPDSTISATLPDLTSVLKPNAFYPHERHYIPSEYYSTTTVYLDISGTTISFAKESDHSTLRTASPYVGLPIVRARIVFQPL